MAKIRAAITGVQGYVPDYVLTNQELETMVDTNDEWIQSRTGIVERRILKGENQGTSVIGAEAVKGLLNGLGIELISIHYAPNTGEIFMVIDSTQEKNATMIMVVFSSGTFRNGEVIPLMTMDEMTESMKKEGGLLGTYKPANSN